MDNALLNYPFFYKKKGLYLPPNLQKNKQKKDLPLPPPSKYSKKLNLEVMKFVIKCKDITWTYIYQLPIPQSKYWRWEKFGYALVIIKTLCMLITSAHKYIRPTLVETLYFSNTLPNCHKQYENFTKLCEGDMKVVFMLKLKVI